MYRTNTQAYMHAATSTACELTLMLLVANLANKNDEKTLKMTEILAYGDSSEGTQRELSNEYQHDMV